MSAARRLALLGLAAYAVAADLPVASSKVIVSISTTPLTPAFLAQYGFSCDQLWTMRNGLYARHGYKFTTARGIRTFSANGTTSNPLLTPLEHRNVAVIRQFERAKACPD